MQVTSLIGKKSYQKQGFLQDGTRVPLTGVIVAGNFVTQIKTSEKDGYNALQIGLDSKRKSRKSITNHSKKAGLEKAARFFREIRVDDVEGATAGSQLNVSEVFSPGDVIDVTGVSKGKGWAGGVKRWGFHGGPRTHGQSDRERAPGSIGQTTTPGRVYKGKKMAGRMGQDTVTVKNLEVIEVTADGVLLIKGLVPGGVNTVVKIKKTGTNKKFVPLYKEVKESEEVKSDESLPASDDAQQNSKDNSNSEPVSLNDSPAPSSEEKKKESLEPAVDSSQSLGTSDAPKEDKKDKEKEAASATSSGEPKEGNK